MESINYGALMIRSMQQLVIALLTRVQEHGLPGKHYFVIEYTTDFPQVEMPEHLRQQYPETMSIVLQHWFEDLEVTQTGFSVILNFGNCPERLVVPIDAVRSFSDPSAKFNLNFPDFRELQDGDKGSKAAGERKGGKAEAKPEAGKDDVGTADIVSLDQFRNRHDG